MPSANVLEQKTKIVADLVDRINGASAGVIVKYQGITVENDTKLRKELREAGVVYTVIKNTLIKKACDSVGYSELGSVLEGMNGIATCDKDPVAAAKIMKKYADTIDSFEIKAGFVQGEVIDKSGVEELAKLPSKEQLVAKMLGSLQAPLYGLVYVLQAYIDKQNETPAA